MTRQTDDFNGKEIPAGAVNYGRQMNRFHLGENRNLVIMCEDGGRCNTLDVSAESFLKILDQVKAEVSKHAAVPESGTKKA